MPHKAKPAKTTLKKVVAHSQPVHQVAAVSCEAYRGLVNEYNWNTSIAMAIMQAESGCNPSAYHVNYNGSTDIGLFQVNSIHGYSNLTDPATNVADAYRVYAGSGWIAWTTYTTGTYLRFL